MRWGGYSYFERGLAMDLATKILERAKASKTMLATAESCTGGLVAAALTSIAGSSEIFDRGFVTYSYQSKTEMLNVSPQLLKTHGAVSQEVVLAMAEGAVTQIASIDNRLAVSVSGVAGPDMSEKKPAGLIWFGIASLPAGGELSLHAEKQNFTGSRQAVRDDATDHALNLLLRFL